MRDMKNIRKSEIAWMIVLVLADQITKWMAESFLSYGQPVEVIPGFFYWTLIYNTGSAWSLGAGISMWFWYILTAAALVLFFRILNRTDRGDRWMRAGLVLIISGAAGNLIDRILYQHVRDFLNFFLFGYDFPVFNAADSFLCVGVAIVLIRVLFFDKGEPENEK